MKAHTHTHSHSVMSRCFKMQNIKVESETFMPQQYKRTFFYSPSATVLTCLASCVNNFILRRSLYTTRKISSINLCVFCKPSCVHNEVASNHNKNHGTLACTILLPYEITHARCCSVSHRKVPRWVLCFLFQPSDHHHILLFCIKAGSEDFQHKHSS